MNNLKSYTEYAVTSSTTDFVIGFDFNYGTDAVNVTVDNKPATEAGYTVVYLNSTTIRLTPAVTSGVVRLQRETDIDAPDNRFTAGSKFIASNMDENFTQVRQSQQEVRDGFNKLSTDTYAIIDTLHDVGQAAQDAADAAEAAAQAANDAAAQVNDKISYQDLDDAVEVAFAPVTDYVALPYKVGKSYALHERVQLANGDIVRSTVNGNTVNPNIIMTGWVKTNATSQIIDVSGLSQQQVNSLKVDKVDVLPITQTKDSFKNAYSTTKANLFEQLRALSACGRCYVWKNPLHAAQADYRFSVGINMSGWKTVEWKFVADADNFMRMEYGYTGAIRSPTAFADATNKVGAVSGSGNNQYFTVVDSSFDLVFTGTGLLINQYVDANGGIFDVYLDGVLLRKMSTNVNNPENAGYVSGNIQKLVVGDLENTAHTVKFVFKGADPSYPPTTSARGWFKNFTGADTHTAAVVTGAEMGMSSVGAKLVANGIIDFAISSRAFGTTMPYDWTPSHAGAVGAMVLHSRKIYMDNTLLDDALTIVNKEKEFKEFTIIQRYTAYNSNDTAKAYPLYDGLLITKFDRVNGLSYAHETTARNKLDVSEGFMSMLSGRRTADLLKFETDNGQTVDLMGAAPATDKQDYVGVVKSARWMGNNTGLAISVDSSEASSSLGKTYADTNPTLFNERTDGFCKLYFKTMGRNSVVEAGTKFVTYHKVWLATL